MKTGIAKKIYALSNIFLLLVLFILPVFIYAEGENNPPAKTNTGITYDCANENPGKKPGDCTFSDLVSATKRVAKYMAELALTFSVIVIAWASGKYLISGDNAGQRTDANKMLLSVAKGIVFILAAWLIVNLITTALLDSTIRKDIPISN